MLLAPLLFPAAGYPLGLGEIRLHSALNQPLSAEIDLLSITAADMQTLNVALASQETFARLGLERAGALMLIDFSVERRADGSCYVKATSRKPIREPFLDFLVELNWRSGRLVREYTVLLDPPERFKESPPPPERRMTAPAVTAEGAPSAVTATAGAAEPRPRSYGPVKPDETLWRIANRLRPGRAVSVPQVMMALLKGNPEAFEGENVNRLKAGAILRFDPSLIEGLPREEAAREIAEQGRQWDAFRQQAAAEAATRAPSNPPEPGADQGEAAREPHLELVAPEKGAVTGDGSGRTDELRRELMLAIETTEAQKQENEELKRRLQELEGQLASMQRLLSLKDQGLATLQQQTAGSEAGGTVAEGPAIEPAAPAGAPLPSEERAPAKPVNPAPPAPPTAAEEPTLIESIVQGIGSNPVAAGFAMLATLGLASLIFLVARRRREAAGLQESLLAEAVSPPQGDDVSNAAAPSGTGEENPFLKEFAGAVSGPEEGTRADPLVEADHYIAYQRFRQAEDLLREAMKQNDRPELHAKLLEIYHAGGDAAGFQSEAPRFHGMVGGKGPLWEKVAILGHELLPDHPLFAGAPQAKPDTLHPSQRPEEEVLDIGLDLDALTAEMEATGGGRQGPEFNLDLGVDLSDLSAPPPESASEEPPAQQAPTERADKAAPPKEEQPEPFNLADLELELPPELAAPPGKAETDLTGASEEDWDLDFDLGDINFSTQTAETPASTEEKQGRPATEQTGERATAGEAGIDMEEVSGLPDVVETPAQEAGGMKGIAEEEGMGLPDADLAGLELHTPAPAPSVSAPSARPSGDDGLFFDGFDETGMKLDLARAYVEMGDAEAARGILGEVLQEGDEAQKKLAQELLKQIAQRSAE